MIRGLRGIVCVVAFVLCTRPAWMRAAAPERKPVDLRCEGMVDALGVDVRRPALSWRLRDERAGALQTAYEVLVYSKPPTNAARKPDVWDSGRVRSDESLEVPYAGPALGASKRYFWRVKLWDRYGRAYTMSDVAWWETGLLDQTAWRAKWIGYEGAELHGVRESGAGWITARAPPGLPQADQQYDFRLRFAIGKPVEKAVLYTTGEDTAAAWINGTEVLKPEPLLASHQMPWGHYVRADVTAELRSGENLLAVGVIRYALAAGSHASSQSPMSACLYVTFSDGTSKVFTTGKGAWTAAVDARDGWWRAGFDDAGWQAAEPYAPKTAAIGGEDVGLPWPTGPVALLRREFKEEQPIVSARLYATALGAYRFHLNGKVVGDQILAPGWTDFREQVLYQVYDVTQQVRRGANVIGAYLAPGWYSTPLMWYGRGNNYGPTQPSLRAQLRVERADGSVEWIVTDASWKAMPSAIEKAEIYDGETRDARREIAGWDQAGTDVGAWHQAMIVPVVEPKIVAQYFAPIRAERVMRAKAITSPSRGVYLFDFGQNMAGVPRLRVRGQRGDEIRLRFGEVLNPDGTLYVANLRTAKATDRFILSGGAEEHFQPQFTFHGFRYAEVSGLRGKPTVETLQAMVLHTDAPFTTKFSSGSAMVNQLWSNVLWSQRSNFIGVPTDCPQRDERLGWSADAQVFWRTASYNMGLANFSRKYASDLRGTQVNTAMYGMFAPGVVSENPGYGAAWSDAGVIVPWTSWIQTGDTRVIEENWDAMRAYVEAIRKNNPDFLWRHDYGVPFGDWLTPTITTPEDLLATAYWAYDARLMSEMAAATGRSAEASAYRELFNNIKTAFQSAYVSSSGAVTGTNQYPSIPPPSVHTQAPQVNSDGRIETQTGYVLALHVDLLPQGLRAAAADRLVAMIRENGWRLGTGFLGTPYLLEVLSDTGHSDVAYRLLLNTEYPSWGYVVEHGGTTTWERWNGDAMRGDPSMNSYNHYAYGAVAEWLDRYAAGIDTRADGAGFRTVYLHPNFDVRLGSLSLDYDSGYGTIRSAWKVSGERVEWEVTVPPNTTAVLQAEQTNARAFVVDGLAFTESRRVTRGRGEGEYTFAAGTYRFSATLR